MKLDTNKALKSVKYNNVDVPLASGLNVFASETQPTAQNGLWIKRAKNEVSKIFMGNDFVLSDGEGATFPNQYTDDDNMNYSVLTKEGNILVGRTFSGHKWVGDSSKGVLYIIKYDLDTGIFTNESLAYTPAVNMTNPHSYSSNSVVKIGNKLYMLGYLRGTDLDVYDIDTNVITNIGFVGIGSGSDHYSKPIAMCRFGNYLYTFTAQFYGTSEGNGGAIYKYDLTTGILTKVSTSIKNPLWYKDSVIASGAAGVAYPYGDIIYVATRCCVWLAFDPETETVSILNKGFFGANNDLGFTNNRSYGDASPWMGVFGLSSDIFFVGIGGLWESTFDSVYENSPYVVRYDILSGTFTKSSIELGTVPSSMSTSQFIGGYCIDGGILYHLFSKYQYKQTGSSSTSTQFNKKVSKFSATSNDFDDGTVICQLSGVENTTELYKDKLVSLNVGFSRALFQQSDGLKVQPAAIIKNGVATDIGGG